MYVLHHLHQVLLSLVQLSLHSPSLWLCIQYHMYLYMYIIYSTICTYTCILYTVPYVPIHVYYIQYHMYLLYTVPYVPIYRTVCTYYIQYHMYLYMYIIYSTICTYTCILYTVPYVPIIYSTICTLYTVPIIYSTICTYTCILYTVPYVPIHVYYIQYYMYLYMYIIYSTICTYYIQYYMYLYTVPYVPNTDYLLLFFLTSHIFPSSIFLIDAHFYF